MLRDVLRLAIDLTITCLATYHAIGTAMLISAIDEHNRKSQTHRPMIFAINTDATRLRMDLVDTRSPGRPLLRVTSKATRNRDQRKTNPALKLTTATTAGWMLRGNHTHKVSTTESVAALPRRRRSGRLLLLIISPGVKGTESCTSEC